MKFLQGPKEDDEGGGVSPLHDLRRVLFSEQDGVPDINDLMGWCLGVCLFLFISKPSNSPLVR